MSTQTGWEVFTLGRSAGRSGKPKIGIQVNGRFGVNEAAAKFLGDYAVMMYNKQTRQIGFKPAQEGDKGAYPVRQAKNQERSFGISGQAFLKFYDLDANEIKGLYPAVEQGGILVITLPPEKK
jgi:hypothetical protein